MRYGDIIPVIPALKTVEQEECGFSDSLDYIIRPCLQTEKSFGFKFFFDLVFLMSFYILVPVIEHSQNLKLSLLKIK